MKIYDENGKELLSIDHTKGWLEYSHKIVKHHNEVPERKEVKHTTVWEGTDIDRVIIDVPYSPAIPAWDEYEYFQVFHPYTQEQLEKPSQEERITALEDAVLELMNIGGTANV